MACVTRDRSHTSGEGSKMSFAMCSTDVVAFGGREETCWVHIETCAALRRC